MEEPNGNKIGNVENFYKIIADSLKGETPTLEAPNCRTEEWLSYIAYLVQQGGTGGGTTDYNKLKNIPIEYKTGTNEAPIYLKDLETGKYIVEGLYMPYENAGISNWANKSFIQIERTETEVYLMCFDIQNNIIEYYKVLIDGSNYERNVTNLNQVKNKTRIESHDRAIATTVLTDNTSYQCSSTDLRKITINFPENIENGYKSWVIFETGAELPTAEFNYENMNWYGEDVVDNVLVLKTNKKYSIEFYLDVFGMKAIVNRDKFNWDYNDLSNKPFTNKTGVEGNEIVLRDLETGGYVLNGTCTPYANSDIYMGANNAITFVSHFDTVTAVQIFYPPYNQVQYFEIYDDNYTTNTVYLNNLATKEYVDNAIGAALEGSY